MQLPSGVRIKDMRPSRDGRLIVTPRAMKALQVSWMLSAAYARWPKIAAAGAGSKSRLLGDFLGGRFIARGGEEHVGVAALLVCAAADLARAEHLEEVMLSSSELTRIMVCKYLVIRYRRVSAFLAARPKGRGADCRSGRRLRFSGQGAGFDRAPSPHVSSLGAAAAGGGGGR
jgi:hypothetical protein